MGWSNGVIVRSPAELATAREPKPQIQLIGVDDIPSHVIELELLLG